MFGHKNGKRTMLSPTLNSKRSLSKGRKGTRSSSYLLTQEIARSKAHKNLVERGPTGKWKEYMLTFLGMRISKLENNLGKAS